MICDALDAAALRQEVVTAAPEVVVHELTALPKTLDPREKGVYDATARIRREGTANLVAAARAAGATRLVAQSIAFVYEPEGGWVKDEEAPTCGTPRASSLRRSTRRWTSSGRCWAPRGSRASSSATASSTARQLYCRDGYQAEEVRRRRFPVVGRGNGTFSFIHVDDAAAATVAAVERGSPGIYNVTDDEPARLRDWLPVFAEASARSRGGCPA